MDGVFEIVEPGEEFTYEFPAQPAGMHLYHCHSTPLKKHIHKGLYGAFIIDPKVPREPARELVLVMNGYDTDGDGGNNFYTVNGRRFYYAKLPDPRPQGRARPRLPREPHRVRPHQLVPPPRGLLPLPADRDRRQLGVHGHGDAVPGPARRARGRASRTRARSCSTRTSPSSPSSAGWATSRSRTVTERAPDGRWRRLAWRLWALVPIVLLALAVARRRLAAATGSSTSIGGTPPPADEFDVRRVEFRAGRDPDPGAQPAAGRPDHRVGDRRRRDRPVHPRRAGDARPAALEHDRRPVRLGPGRPDRRRRHELDGDRDGRGDRRRPCRRRSRARAASSATGSSGCSSASSPSRSACSGCRRCAAPSPRWLAAFMALTAGLLTFLGVEALVRGARRSRPRCPAALGGPGLVLLGVAASALGMTFLVRAALPRAGPASPASRSPCSSRSGSASTTSARGSRSGRRSRPASSSSARSS